VIPPRVAKEISVLFGPAARVTLVEDRGLSTAIVYRVETLSNWYALKRWPILMDRDRLNAIHRFQQYLSDGDKACTPRLLKWCHGETLLEAEGVYWEIAEWKSGHPVERLGQSSQTQLLNCVEAIARLHEQSRSYEALVQIAPGLKQRYEGLLHAIEPIEHKRNKFLDSISSHDQYESTKTLKEIYLRAMRVIPQVIEPLHRLSETPTVCFWVLRDVWREHLLYRGDQVVGILDFGAARIDWPGLDLARSIGTLLLDSDPRWSIAHSAYLQRRPDCQITLPDLKNVHRASVALSALQWLDWFAEGQFDWTNQSSRYWNRVLELQRQLADIEKPETSGILR
jgi:Ser/Thr protein kinase RdoA (MazF antagonist)